MTTKTKSSPSFLDQFGQGLASVLKLPEEWSQHGDFGNKPWQPAPAEGSTPTKAKAPTSTQPQTVTVPSPFDLGKALAPLVQPYVAAANAAASGPGLSTYLNPVPQGIASTLQQGQNAENAALAPLSGDISKAASQAGNTSLLQDLLAAAKYQEVYKQNQYGALPTDPFLAQLYRTVANTGAGIGGGGALPFPGQTPVPTTAPAKPPNLG